MATSRPLPPLLLLGVALLAGHVTGQALKLSPSRTEHVKYAGKALVVSCRGRDPVGMVWKNPSGKEITERQGPLIYPSANGSVEDPFRVHVEPSQSVDGLKGVDLLLKSIKRKDSGMYRCEARVNGQREVASFELTVYQPIQFVSRRVEFAPEGSDVTLLCDVTGEPKPEVSWRGLARPQQTGQNQHPCDVSSGQKLEVTGVAQRLEIGPDKKFDVDPETNGLVIRNLARSDDGKYRCRATQVNEKDSEFCEVDVQLVVQYKPELKGAPRAEAYGFLGGSVNLSCEADAKPSPEFAWHRGDRLLESDGTYELLNTETMSVLQIRWLGPEMFGEYRCEARNQHGKISRTIALVEREEPATPRLSVTKAESSRLTLELSVARGEERPDRYRVEYRPADPETGWAAATAVEFRPGDSYVISNLQPDTEYVLRAAAGTQAGLGEFSSALPHRTAAAGEDPSASGAQPLVLSLLVALLTAALLVI